MSDLIDPIINNPAVQLSGKLCLVFLAVFTIAMIFWTWRDADRRGAMPWFWAAVVLFFNVAGWAIYMIVRPPEYEEDARERELEIQAREVELARESGTCPSCLRPIEPEFLICPYCMKKLKKQCVSCGKALKMSWAVCPYCKTKQQPRDPAAPTGTPEAPVTSRRR